MRKDSIIVAFTRLAPFIIVNVMALVWALYSPTDIFVTYPRLFLWMLGLLNSKLVVSLHDCLLLLPALMLTLVVW